MLRKFLYIVSWTAMRIFSAVWFRVRIEGSENIPASGPVLVVSNHCSTLDPPLVAIGIRNRMLTFLAKKELWQSAVLGGYLTRIGAIPVDRTADSDRRAIASCLKSLKESRALLVFPEGTRSPDGTLQPLKPGSARMALAVEGTQIVPVCISGTRDALPSHARFPRPRRVTIRYGKPFPAAAEGLNTEQKKSLYQALTDAMFTRISELQESN